MADEGRRQFRADGPATGAGPGNRFAAGHVRRAYTLIEVVVCLAITAVLAALIFTALGPAREHGRRAVCASNMHQWGVALSLYFADYGSAEPVQGASIAPAALGFPVSGRGWVAWEKAMHLFMTPVSYCPDFTGNRGGQVTSYDRPALWVLHDNTDYTRHLEALIEARGPAFRIVTCDWHNPFVPWHTANLPTWTTKRVGVIYYDQSLHWETIPYVTATEDY